MGLQTQMERNAERRVKLLKHTEEEQKLPARDLAAKFFGEHLNSDMSNLHMK